MIDYGVLTERSVTKTETGRFKIRWPEAKLEWNVNYSASKVLKDSQIRKPRPKPQTPPPSSEKPAEEEDDAPVQEQRPVGQLPDGRKSKNELDRLFTELKVQKAALELREKKKELVQVSAVYRVVFELGQMLRKDMLTVPDKVLDNVRAAKTRAEAYSILYDAIAKALDGISNIEEGDLKLFNRR